MAGAATVRGRVVSAVERLRALWQRLWPSEVCGYHQAPEEARRVAEEYSVHVRWVEFDRRVDEVFAATAGEVEDACEAIWRLPVRSR